MYLSMNSPLTERLAYCPAAVGPDEVPDALAELDALRSVCEDNGVDPDNAAADLEALEAKRDELALVIAQHQSFLEDCMNALSGYWPTGADINDPNLLRVIVEAIQRGEGTAQ